MKTMLNDMKFRFFSELSQRQNPDFSGKPSATTIKVAAAIILCITLNIESRKIGTSQSLSRFLRDSALLILIFGFGTLNCFASLVLNGAYTTMNGGTSSTPIYLVVNQTDAAGITRLAGGGHIISENEYNIVKWNNIGTTLGTYTFPLGKGTTTYIPFVFDKTTNGTVATTGSVFVSTWYTLDNTVVPTTAVGVTMCPSEASAIDRFWVIDVNGYSANPTATVDFYYKDDVTELDGISENNLKAQRWNAALGGTCKWEPPVGAVNTTNDYVRVSNISSFSPWTLTNETDPLPIWLLWFKAQWFDNSYKTALLEWRTTSEMNIDYYDIQRSRDGYNFTTAINGVKANSPSYQIRDYQQLDNEANKDGFTYYRLRVVNYDGKEEFSNTEVISVPFGIDIISIYGNPSADKITTEVISSLNTNINIGIYNPLGQKVKQESNTVVTGKNYYTIDLSDFSSGCYFLFVETESGMYRTQKQFVKGEK